MVNYIGIYYSFTDKSEILYSCHDYMIPPSQQNTPDIEGYYYTANDGSQMAFWIYKADRISKEHTHDYDELFIPKDSVQGGRVKAGTRSIHAFGGQRIKG